MSRCITAIEALVMMGLLVVLLVPEPAAGQTVWPKGPKLPMAKTWQVEKAKLPPYRPPRTPDGQPDLQGHWDGAPGDNNSYLEDHEYLDDTTPAQESFVSDPPDGRIPYTPWALATRMEILRSLARGWPGETGERLHVSPGSFCLHYMPVFSFDAHEIVQKPGYVVMLSDDTYRVIPTDGRAAIGPHAKFWLGTSRGRWEGDTLVVEVTSLNGKGWFDSTGQFYSENTRMIERWRLADANTMDYTVTVEDPTIYTRPWTMNIPRRRAGTGRGPRGRTAVSDPTAVEDKRYANEMWETGCYEGNAHTIAVTRSLGFKWFSGVTPPK